MTNDENTDLVLKYPLPPKKVKRVHQVKDLCLLKESFIKFQQSLKDL